MDDVQVRLESRRRAHLTIFLLALGTGSAAIPATAVLLMSSNFEQAERYSSLELTFALGATGLGLTCVPLMAGGLADHVGYRRVFLSGSLIACAAITPTAFSRSFPIVFSAALAVGMGQGLQTVSAMVAIRELLPGDRRVRAYAVFGASSSVVIAGGVTLSGALLFSGFPHLALLAGCPFLIISGLGVAWLTRDSHPPKRRRRPDRLGMLISVLASAAAFMGAGMMTAAPGAPTSLAVAGLGVLLITVFLFFERQRRHPLLDIGMLRHKTFAAVAIIAALAGFAVVGLINLGIQYSLFVLELDGGAVAAMSALSVILVAAVSMASPALVRRFSLRRVVFTSLALGAATCAARALLMNPHHVGNWLLGLSVIPVLIAAITPGLRSQVAAVLAPDNVGSGFGLIDATRYLIAAIGTAVIVGTFASQFASRMPDALDHAGLHESTSTSVGSALSLRSVQEGRAPDQSPIASPIPRDVLTDIENSVFIDSQRTGLVLAGIALLAAALVSLSLTSHSDPKPSPRSMTT